MPWRHYLDHAIVLAGMVGAGFGAGRRRRWLAAAMLSAAGWRTWACHRFHHGDR